MAAGAAGPLHAELARRIAAQEITLHHAIAHYRALARGDALLVERPTGHAARLERPLLDAHQRRKHLLAQAVGEERSLAIEVAAVDPGNEVADQADGHRRLEQDASLAGGNLAAAET